MRTSKPEGFDWSYISNLKEEKIGKGRVKRGREYAHAVAAFDIETTNDRASRQAFMYVWMFQIDKRPTVIGRTWKEFREFVARLNEELKQTLVVCVHNLAFEWQFIKTLIPIDSVFALDDRKVLYFRSGKLEFRCTYLHSNMSLRKYLERMNVPTQKGEMDYSIPRWPWTKLTKEELSYCVADVKGLVEAYTKEMKLDKDNLYTIPLTSTGYVRRSAKMALQAYQKYIKPQLPDLETLLLLQAAYRGGNTHGSVFWASRIVEDVRSYDLASSYPSVLMEEEYPTVFEDVPPEDLPKWLKKGYAALMEAELFNVRLKDPLWGCPYIAFAKCLQTSGADDDNGRIREAKYIRLAITEIDLSILRSEYDFDMNVIRLKVSKKRKLPIAFRKMILDLYQQKTELKGGDADQEYLYGKMKNRINALYGMTVMNPIRPVYSLNEETHMLELDPGSTPEDRIERYLRHGWLPYQVGVWCCAYARLRLEKGLHAIPATDFLYADTDSIKFKGDHAAAFEKLNKKLYDPKYTARDRYGKEHPAGIFEEDGHYKRFCHLGAKKYVYEDMDGKLHVTIAGVNKKEGPAELGAIENFRPGFVFRKAGGQIAVYNELSSLPSDRLEFPEGTVELTTNLYLEDSTYTLSLAPDYDMLINWLSSHDLRKDLMQDFAVKHKNDRKGGKN